MEHTEDPTDTEQYLKDLRYALCRARKHRYPEPSAETVVANATTSVVGTWVRIHDHPNANMLLALECERGCGTEKRRLAYLDKRGQVTFVGKTTTYDPDYLLAGGARIAPAEAEAAILRRQAKPLAEKARRKPPHAKKKPQAPRRTALRAVAG